MVLNAIWLDWLSDEENENGDRIKLKDNTPDDIREEYEKIIAEEKNMGKNELKKTIF